MSTMDDVMVPVGRADSNRGFGERVIRASVAPFLILLTPFVGYVQYQRHGFVNPEVALFLLLLAGLALLLGAGSAVSPAFSVATLAGLLTFLVDIQAREPGLKKLGVLFLVLCAIIWVLRRHAHRIVSLMMATVVLSLVILPPRSEAVTSAQSSTALPAASEPRDLPLVLHLLVDEFIGAEGLPRELTPPGFKQQLESFFTERQFRLFGNAYSEYPITKWSVPHLLNLAPGGYIADLTAAGPSEGTFRLTRNAYFERLVSMGYSIQVHQPDYMYVCPDGVPASCRTYATRSLDVLNGLEVPLDTKVRVLGGTFLGQSETYTRAKERYRTTRRRLARTVPLPAWNWERSTPASAGSMPMFDAVAKDLSKAQRGTFVFAHVLMPHHPYVFDANCRQRPQGEWLGRNDAERGDIAGGIMNVADGRATRYAAYFQQIACTEKKIDELLAAIPAPLRHDAIIIIQGDHGSRIALVDPTTSAKVSPAVSDFADGFSTMFAVRSPSIAAGSDLRTTPITCLLRTLVESGFQSTAGIDSCSSPNVVFFMAGGKRPAPRPLPDFSNSAAPSAVTTPGRQTNAAKAQ
jgi:hypothetical protein